MMQTSTLLNALMKFKNSQKDEDFEVVKNLIIEAQNELQERIIELNARIVRLNQYPNI